LQNKISLIDGHDDPLQIQHSKADVVDCGQITLLKSKAHSLFVFCGDVAIFVKLEVIDEERKGK
jgi:hypothetical protein